MMKRIVILLLIAIILPAAAFAQRKVTPVDVDDKKPAQPSLHYYDKHGKPLEEPVLFLATLDTVATEKTEIKPIYPKYSELNVGLNIFDAVLALSGSDYGGASVWANLGIRNRFFPIVEIGVGTADRKPDGNNYHYKGNVAPYFKLGADYNFLHKSKADYQLLAGLRLGFSSFKYSLEDVAFGSDYWDETQVKTFDSLGCTDFWGELCLGIKVKITGNFSMGWNVGYRFLFSDKSTTLKPGESSVAPYGAEFKPWYIPGYGKRTSHLGFSFSAIYTLPWQKPVVAPDEKNVK